MKLIDIAIYSLKSLRHRHMRSWLTILGIVIGIAAIVSLITIGQGFNIEVENQLSALGANTIFITPIAESSSSASSFGPSTSPTSGKLYEKDVERVKKIAQIDDVTRLVTGRTTIEYRDKEITSSIMGIEPGVFEKTTAISMAEGRFLQDNDRRVAVIGSTVAEETFGQNNKVGVNSYLVIDGNKYRVIGIIEKSGGGFGYAGMLDSGIFVHFEDGRQLFRDTLGENEVRAIAVLVSEGADMNDVVESIKLEIDASHRVKEEERDYSVVSPDSIKDSIGAVLSMITLFLGAIASISLIVGGLAIASGMITSVMERTHEIGILKAVGATEGNIMQIFLFEAGALGGIGGLIGTGLGLLAVFAGSLFGLPAYINPWIAAFGILFSFVIGIAAGYFPSKNAAKLPPVEALRYE